MTPRAIIVTACAAVLRRIRTTDGYLTDAGDHVTTEPAQIDDDQKAVIAVVVEKQSRASDPALVKTHRLTTIAIVAKLRVEPDAVQSGLDALTTDIEKALENKQPDFPVGFQFPQYAEMQPLGPDAGMGWTGAVLRYQSHIPIRTP